MKHRSSSRSSRSSRKRTDMLFQNSMTSRSETSLLSDSSIAHPDLLASVKQLDACLSLLSDGHLLRQLKLRTPRNSFLLDVHACIVEESNTCRKDIEALDNYLQLAGLKGIYNRVVLGVKRRTDAQMQFMQVMPKTLDPYEERVRWCRWMTEELVDIVRGHEDGLDITTRALRSRGLYLRRQIDNLRLDMQVLANGKLSSAECLVLMQAAHNLENDHDMLRSEAKQFFKGIGGRYAQTHEVDDLSDLLPKLMDWNIARKLWRELLELEEMHRQVIEDLAELIRTTSKCGKR